MDKCLIAIPIFYPKTVRMFFDVGYARGFSDQDLLDPNSTDDFSDSRPSAEGGDELCYKTKTIGNRYLKLTFFIEYKDDMPTGEGDFDQMEGGLPVGKLLTMEEAIDPGIPPEQKERTLKSGYIDPKSWNIDLCIRNGEDVYSALSVEIDDKRQRGVIERVIERLRCKGMRSHDYADCPATAHVDDYEDSCFDGDPDIDEDAKKAIGQMFNFYQHGLLERE